MHAFAPLCGAVHGGLVGSVQTTSVWTKCKNGKLSAHATGTQDVEMNASFD
jgi:hypothetical protein